MIYFCSDNGKYWIYINSGSLNQYGNINPNVLAYFDTSLECLKILLKFFPNKFECKGCHFNNALTRVTVLWFRPV